MRWPGLLDRLVDFDARVYRNIPTCAPSQHLLDDLSDDPAEWAIGERAAGEEGQQELEPLLSRPFVYGIGIASGAGTPLSRFSDGAHYGVWYGSLEPETTLYETVYHWLRFLSDAQLAYAGDVVADRRIFKARAAGLLIDLRGKETTYPALLNPDDYGFTHAVGNFIHDENQSGLIIKSARWEAGTNAAIFRPSVLSAPRHDCHAYYHWQPGSKQVRVERPRGKLWLTVG